MSNNNHTHILYLISWLACLLPPAVYGSSFAPAPPVRIAPDTFRFAPRQINTLSPEKTFYIHNLGDAPRTIGRHDISIVAEGPQSAGLSILTYNLWHDAQSWPARFVHMLHEIRTLDPDIIGLQEVIQRANLKNQAALLADSLGYYYYFASRDPESSAQRFGNAILSRHPIEEANWRALQPLTDYRTAVHARINVHGNIIDFYNTHLHNAAVNVHIREAQINDLLDFIETTHSGGFAFVTGDYNANPDWPEMALMYADFFDVYALFHEDHLEPWHGTLNHNLGHQQRRIDYIFSHKDNAGLLKPVSADVVLNTSSQAGVWGSDHFGVFARFQILSDADAFLQRDIPETNIVQPSDSLAVGLVYAPFATGNHQAILKVFNEQATLSGEGFDATISLFPWKENFDTTTAGTLPVGWESVTDHWQVLPDHDEDNNTARLSFTALPGTEGSFMVHTPPIQTEGLDSMLLIFRHAAFASGNSHDITFKIICLSDGLAYPVAAWNSTEGLPSGNYTAMLYRKQHSIGSAIQLAWLAEGETSDTLSWHIDDIEFVAMPALSVSPLSYNFGEQQIHTPSAKKEFTLTNKGGGSISIAPADILLSGEHADAFTLANIDQTIVLTDTVHATLGITFMPETSGIKTAHMEVGNKLIPLQGMAFDPTITSLPWTEDFADLSGGGLPGGWASNSAHWGAFNAAHAGGEAPEMVFWWQPETSGKFYLATPEITITEKDSLVLSFKHRIRDFGDPGKYTLSVVILAGNEEYIVHQWVDPALQPAEEFTALLVASDHGIGQSLFQIAWVFNGITDNITQWDIDDVSLEVLGSQPKIDVSPKSYDFGRQTIRTSSAPFFFTVQNQGGGDLIIPKEAISISGPDETAFQFGISGNEIILPPFASTQISVIFSPETPGSKLAYLNILETGISLTGLGTEVVPYFIYSDFTIAEGGRQYTNVDGFREVPAFARNGSLIASDKAGEGTYGGVVLQLAYNLALTSSYTIYYMWAYPHTNLSAYDQILIYAKASVPVTNIRLQMQDTRGVQGTDGAGFAYFNVGTTWQKIAIPIGELTPMPWAAHLPDMSRIQKIDLMFEKGITSPGEAIVYVDLIGFEKQAVSAKPPHQEFLTRMYPNPASQQVHIMAEPGSLVSLIDMTGRIVLAQESRGNTTNIDVSAIKKGLYLVRIDGVSGMEIKKLSVY